LKYFVSMSYGKCSDMNKHNKFIRLIDWLINWCLMLTLEVFQLCRGVIFSQRFWHDITYCTYSLGSSLTKLLQTLIEILFFIHLASGLTLSCKINKEIFRNCSTLRLVQLVHTSPNKKYKYSGSFHGMYKRTYSSK
jgi:hypothetical protein